MNKSLESNHAGEIPRNAEAGSDARPKKRISAFGELFGVLLLTCGLSIFVRLAYFPLFFASDDMDFLVQVGLYEIGRIDFLEFCAFPQGAHTMMLWKLIFLGEWKTFGLDPTWWHLVLAVMQGFSATALYFCARAWSINRIGAFTMALIWAGAAIGGWDNPTLWLMCGMAPLAWFFFLIVLKEIAVVGKKNLPASASRWAALRMSAMYFLSILTWSDMLLVAPVVLLALLMRGITRQPRSVLVSWAAAWAVPLLLLAPINAALILPSLGSGGRLQERTPLDVVSRTAGQFGVALGSLTYANVTYPEVLDTEAYPDPHAFSESELLWPKLLMAVVLLLIAGVASRGEAGRFVLVFLTAVLIYLLLANAGGIALTFRDAINHGHYLYFPVLFWAVVLGTLISRLASRKRSIRPLTVIFLPLLVIFVVHQRSMAATTAEIQRYMFAVPTERFKTTEAILRSLSHQAEQEGTSIELPDSPLPLNSSSCPYWPLKAFAALTFPDGLPGVKIIPPEEVLEQQVLDAADRLQAENEPQADLWASRMQQIYPTLAALSWLIETSAEYPQRIVCPNVRLDLWGADVALRQLLRHGFSRGRRLADHLQGDSPLPLQQDYPELSKLLESSNREEATILLHLFGWGS